MLRYILAQNGAGAAFVRRAWNHTGDRVNCGGWVESGQMPVRCGIVQRNGGKGLAQAGENKIFRKHGVRGKNGL